MAIRIIVDANPIISALIGGISRNVFFDKRFEFLTTEFTLNEVKKYIPTISKKSGINEEEINYALRLLPIIVVFREEYEKYILEAERWIAEIDKKDVHILALALSTTKILWSEDKHFAGIEAELSTGVSPVA